MTEIKNNQKYDWNDSPFFVTPAEAGVQVSI